MTDKGKRKQVRRVSRQAVPTVPPASPVGPVKKLRAMFWQSASSEEPVRDWLKKEVGEEDRKAIGKDIAVVEFGWPVGMPTLKAIKDGLYELRSTISDRRKVRIICAIDNGQLILLHIFIKKRQKLGKHDLDIAKSRMQERENGK